MRRSAWLLLLGAVLVAALGARTIAAAKSYQFTGTVKAVDATTLTVEKSAAETWTFSTDSKTKGSAKVGDKVTVHYTMTATDIESKAAGPAKKPAK